MIRKSDVDNYHKGSYNPENDRGAYFAPEGVPFENRALPYNADDYIEIKFEVLKPFDTKKSLATPWFNQPGMGVQHQITGELVDSDGMPLDGQTISNLIKGKYIHVIKK